MIPFLHRATDVLSYFIIVYSRQQVKSNKLNFIDRHPKLLQYDFNLSRGLIFNKLFLLKRAISEFMILLSYFRARLKLN